MLTREFHADLETPVTALLKLRAQESHAFLFESVEGNEVWGAFSMIGVGVRRLCKVTEHEAVVTRADGEKVILSCRDPLDGARQAWLLDCPEPPAGAPPFVGGMFGFLSYDAVRSFERLPEASGPREVPDAMFFEPEVLAVFDNRRHSLTLYSHTEARLAEAVTRLNAPLPTLPTQRSQGWQKPTTVDSPERFQAAVAEVQEHIRAGDIIQAVLSRRFELPRIADPFNVYRGLRTINPSPYLFYLAAEELELAGASPEVMVRVQDGTAIVRPIAGTRPRGNTLTEDHALAEELLADPKERAEHIMLVDLGRNDVGRVALPGKVDVSQLMVVERYSHVMHIVSEVQGRLNPECDAFDTLRAAFPAGTLSGAPKVRAMQIIDRLEGRRRGVYGGAVGYFGPHGDADFGIAIRTLAAFPDRLVVQAGCGIVADSHPVTETEETEHKARAVMRAIEWATSEAT